MGRQYNRNFSKNKYKAVKQTYNGYSYDSILEASYAAQLDLLIKAKEVKSWDRQVKISIDINDVHICNYFIDFKVYYVDGREEFHEVKGYETDVWKMKWKLAKALYPDNNFVLIK
jgi:hypothetical protein